MNEQQVNLASCKLKFCNKNWDKNNRDFLSYHRFMINSSLRLTWLLLKTRLVQSAKMAMVTIEGRGYRERLEGRRRR